LTLKHNNTHIRTTLGINIVQQRGCNLRHTSLLSRYICLYNHCKKQLSSDHCVCMLRKTSVNKYL